MGRVVRDRYELGVEIAEGPLGSLWRGQLRADAGFGRLVAVRELAPRFARDPRFVGTWAATASELSRLAGPNIEQMLDLVVEGERVYLVTEWIEGVSLTRWVRGLDGEPFPWPLAVRLGVGLLHGLIGPHANQPALLHGGITPSAVRVGLDGTVKLTRFGASSALAAAGAGQAELEANGARHRAPELARGDAATPATDQHAVAALLFELLTGEPPFADLEAGDARDLSDHRDDAPALLAAHLAVALRREPADRFDSVDTMARALAQLVRTTSAEADRASLAEAVDAARSRVSSAPPEAPLRGPAALAASLRSMVTEPAEAPSPGARPKIPVGLPEDRTMAVSVSELQELPRVSEPPEPDAEEAVGEAGDEASQEAGEHPEAEEKKRYKFQPKDRSATRKVAEERARGLSPQESEAAPLPLTKSKRPEGLAPARTEFLDDLQVDQLTLGKAPTGLGAARTEFLDDSQVDRLTVAGAADEAAKARSKAPTGLAPARTEFLDEDEVDRLAIGDDEEE